MADSPDDSRPTPGPLPLKPDVAAPPAPRPVFLPPRPTPGAPRSSSPPPRSVLTPVPRASTEGGASVSGVAARAATPPPLPPKRVPPPLPAEARAQQGVLRPPPLPTAPPPAPERSDSLRVSELSARLAAREEALGRAHQELEAARSHAAALIAELHKHKLAAEQLQARVRSEAELRAHLSEEQAESERQRRERVEELERQLASLHELQASVSELRVLAAGAARYQGRNAELESDLAAARQRIAELEQRPALPGSSTDELTRIRGIGPAFERALRAHGIHSLAQIAALQDADIAALAPLLRVRPERIARDDWRGQAAALLAGQQPAKPPQTE